MKVYQVKASDSCVAEQDTVYIACIIDQLVQRHGVCIVDSPEVADICLVHEGHYAAGSKYYFDVCSCDFVRKYLNKMITIHWPDNPSGILRGTYINLVKSRMRHDRHTILPHFNYTNPYVLNPPEFKGEPQHLASYRGNLKSHPVRRKLMNELAGKEGFLMESTDSWFNHSADEHLQYVKMILNSKFVISPAGFSAISYRAQESMALSRVPVIISDDYPDKMAFWDPLSKAIRVREDSVHEIPNILNDYESAWEELGKEAKKEWEKINPDNLYILLAQLVLEMYESFPRLALVEENKYIRSREFRKLAEVDLMSRIKNRVKSKLGMR